jgi:hypothetical protein
MYAQICIISQMHTKTSIKFCQKLGSYRTEKRLNAASRELKQKFPKLIANIVIAAIFTASSQLAGWILKGINADVVFLLRIGLLLGAGIFLVRTLFDALTVTDKATKLLLKRVGIKKEQSKQRIFKDIICIVATLLVVAALGPILNGTSSINPTLNEIMTYAAMALILLFVYDIARTLYRITENKANGLANRISSSKERDETNGK